MWCQVIVVMANPEIALSRCGDIEEPGFAVGYRFGDEVDEVDVQVVTVTFLECVDAFGVFFGDTLV